MNHILVVDDEPLMRTWLSKSILYGTVLSKTYDTAHLKRADILRY